MLQMLVIDIFLCFLRQIDELAAGGAQSENNNFPCFLFSDLASYKNQSQFTAARLLHSLLCLAFLVFCFKPNWKIFLDFMFSQHFFF